MKGNRGGACGRAGRNGGVASGKSLSLGGCDVDVEGWPAGWG